MCTITLVLCVQVPMHPWYRGFKGTITEVPTKTSGRSYAITGIMEQVGRLMV